MDWLYYFLLFAAMILGLLINLLGLPGLWIMVAAALAYAWTTHWAYVGWGGLVTLVLLGLAAEAVEFLAGSAGAKKAGGSKRAMAGAIVGGLVGAIAGSPIFPVVGTIIGAVAGSFAGALLVEYLIGKTASQSFQVGVGAAKGRLWGIVSKSAIGMVMLIVAMAAALPIGGRSTATTAPATTTGPTTLPAATTESQINPD